jgi:hypothetical protein
MPKPSTLIGFLSFCPKTQHAFITQTIYNWGIFIIAKVAPFPFSDHNFKECIIDIGNMDLYIHTAHCSFFGNTGVLNSGIFTY